MATTTRESYKVGWNDIEYGINHWPTAGCEKWSSALEWALHCRDIALACKPSARDSAYYDGVIDCVKRYQETGRVSRRE